MMKMRTYHIIISYYICLVINCLFCKQVYVIVSKLRDHITKSRNLDPYTRFRVLYTNAYLYTRYREAYNYKRNVLEKRIQTLRPPRGASYRRSASRCQIFRNPLENINLFFFHSYRLFILSVW